MFERPQSVPWKYLLLFGAVLGVVTVAVGASAGAAWADGVGTFLMYGFAGGVLFRRPGAPVWQTALRGVAFAVVGCTLHWTVLGAPWER